MSDGMKRLNASYQGSKIKVYFLLALFFEENNPNQHFPCNIPKQHPLQVSDYGSQPIFEELLQRKWLMQHLYHF